MGYIAHQQWDFATAQDFCQQSFVLSRAIGGHSDIAINLLSLGYIAHQQGDFATAQDYSEQSLILARASGNQSYIAMSLLGLGALAYEHRGLATASDYYEQGLTLARAIGDQYITVLALSYLATLAFGQGASDLVGLLREGLNIGLKTGTYPVLLNLLVTTGRWTAPQYPSEVARLAGLIAGHSAMNTDTRKLLGNLQRELEALLPAEELATLTAEGATLDLATTAREWLARIDEVL